MTFIEFLRSIKLTDFHNTEHIADFIEWIVKDENFPNTYDYKVIAMYLFDILDDKQTDDFKNTYIFYKTEMAIAEGNTDINDIFNNLGEIEYIDDLQKRLSTKGGHKN